MIGSLPFFRVLLILLWIGIFPAGGNLARVDYSDSTPALIIQERDWYFTGNYPTPGGYSMVNRAYLRWSEGIGGRSYDLPL